MKRAIVALLALLTLAIGVSAYLNASTAQQTRLLTAATRTGRSFVWPSDQRIADPKIAYDALLAAARAEHVNVFRTSSAVTASGQSEVRQYVLLTTGTRFFDSFNLETGHWLSASDSQSPNTYMASVASRDPHQVGTLGVFGRSRVSVLPLENAYTAVPVAGAYVVETATGHSPQAFLQRLAVELTARTGARITAATFHIEDPSYVAPGSGLASRLRIVAYLGVAVVLLLLTYYVLFAAKRIGVLKLNGVGSLRVWYRVVGRLLLITIGVTIGAVVVGGALVPGAAIGFVTALTGAVAGVDALLLITSLLACVYISRMRLGESLKHRRKTGGTFVLNAGLKVLCAVLVGVFAVQAWQQHTQLSAQHEQADHWSKTANFAVFYPNYVGNDRTDLTQGLPGATTAEVYGLYPVLNRRGAIYIDASSYEPGSLASETPDTIRSIQVNPNYLSAYPVRDVTGQNVHVPESTTAWVLLVPAEYKAQRKQILRYFQTTRTGGSGTEGAVQAEKQEFGQTAPSSIAHQHVKIMWTAPHQRIFSFDSKVFPAEGNTVTDPIVQVMTTANSLGVDRANMMTGDGNDAMKVRVPPGDPAAVMTALEPTLRKLKLDDNLRYLVTTNQVLLDQAHAIRAEILLNLALMAILLVGLLAFEWANIAILYQALVRRFVVRRLVGSGFWRTYKELGLFIVSVWIVQTGLLFAVLHLEQGSGQPGDLASAPGPIIWTTSIIVLLVEAAFAGVAMSVVERRNLVTSLKGWF